jgi:hypothetical protein
VTCWGATALAGGFRACAGDFFALAVRSGFSDDFIVQLFMRISSIMVLHGIRKSAKQHCRVTTTVSAKKSPSRSLKLPASALKLPTSALKPPASAVAPRHVPPTQ